jgi:hypothetical protein
VRKPIPPITEDRAFWTIFAVAMCVAVASPVLPDVVRSVDADWNIRVSYSLAAIWLLLEAIAIVRHRWRGLWLLIGLPIVLYRRIAFRLLEYQCRQTRLPVYRRTLLDQFSRNARSSAFFSLLFLCSNPFPQKRNRFLWTVGAGDLKLLAALLVV